MQRILICLSIYYSNVSNAGLPKASSNIANSLPSITELQVDIRGRKIDQLANLAEYTAAVNVVIQLRDGRRASVSVGHTIKLWDLS